MNTRESMEFDLVIVGGGPAGLSAAIRAKQLANEAGKELDIVVLEKGGEIGAHILSGIVMDPAGLNALLPEWQARDDAPLKTRVTSDKFIALGPRGALDISFLPMPGYMKNHGNYVGSLANVCRFLAREAENLGIQIFPGFPASDVVYDDKGVVRGVIAGKMGVARDGSHKPDFEPGMELRGKYVLLAEGARGSLSKQVIKKYQLDEGREPQKYGIGLKELWLVPHNHPHFREGHAQHTIGWPLDDKTGGGSFLYHFTDNGEAYISLGFVVHLNYANPWLSPHAELQRWKHHPDIAKYIMGAKRVAYGARAITEGGYQSVPRLVFPGGALIGCAAGFVNLPRIKGSHNAILTGMMAAEAAVMAIHAGRDGDELEAYETAYAASSVRKELYKTRNAKPFLSKTGTFLGTLLAGIDMWTIEIFGGFSFFGTQKHGKPDHTCLKPADACRKIVYPKPDGVLSFDRLTNVSFTNTYHEEDQPVHLKVADLEKQKTSEYAVYAGPSARYCPAGVYEWIEEKGKPPRFQINAQNCIHCKTCDIKDPNQNIDWCTPEGGGPAYPNM